MLPADPGGWMQVEPSAQGRVSSHISPGSQCASNSGATQAPAPGQLDDSSDSNSAEAPSLPTVGRRQSVWPANPAPRFMSASQVQMVAAGSPALKSMQIMEGSHSAQP